MKKSDFIAIVEHAQAHKSNWFETETVFNAVKSLAGSILRKFSIDDPEQAEADTYLKAWSTGKVYQMSPLEICCYISKIAMNTGRDRYREDKHRHQHEIPFCAFDEDHNDNEYRESFVDSIPDSQQTISEAIENKETIRNFFFMAIKARQLPEIVKALEINKKQFSGASVSGYEFYHILATSISSYFSEEEMMDFEKVLVSLEEISVDKLYYKIYNDRKAEKKKTNNLSEKKRTVHIIIA